MVSYNILLHWLVLYVRYLYTHLNAAPHTTLSPHVTKHTYILTHLSLREEPQVLSQTGLGEQHWHAARDQRVEQRLARDGVAGRRGAVLRALEHHHLRRRVHHLRECNGMYDRVEKSIIMRTIKDRECKLLAIPISSCQQLKQRSTLTPLHACAVLCHWQPVSAVHCVCSVRRRLFELTFIVFTLPINSANTSRRAVVTGDTVQGSALMPSCQWKLEG